MGVAISAGQKNFLNSEIVLYVGLGAVASAVGVVLGRCGCLCCRVSFAVCGRFCGFIRGNKKSGRPFGFPLWLCVNTSTIDTRKKLKTK